MAETGESEARKLAALRARIDVIDEAMHRLLVERSSVIDELIAAKGTGQGGAAFRPQREAAMMRALAGRHSGHLPLPAVEHLWREIITTFTYLQAPFRVVLAAGGDPGAARDAARFAFGFTVELVEAASAADAIAAVMASGTDLALVPLAGAPSRAWWRNLSLLDGPRVIAVLPFVTMRNRPAGMPALVISPRVAEPAPPDLLVIAASLRQGRRLPAGMALLAEAPDGEALLALDPGDLGRLEQAGASDIQVAGGIARGIAVDGEDDPLRAPLRRRVPA